MLGQLHSVRTGGLADYTAGAMSLLLRAFLYAVLTPCFCWGLAMPPLLKGITSRQEAIRPLLMFFAPIGGWLLLRAWRQRDPSSQWADVLTWSVPMAYGLGLVVGFTVN